MEAERAKLMGSGQLGQKTENGPLKVRAFFGLPLPEAQRNQLDRYLSVCAASAPEFRWTPAPNLHLTVRFLGQVEGSLAEGIAGRLADARLQAFDLKLGQVGTFNRGRLARVVWLGVTSGAEDVAAVDHGYLRSKAGKEQGLFHGGITSADNRDFFPREKKPIAGGARGNPVTDELLLVRQTQPARRRSAGNDQSLRVHHMMSDV